MIRNEPVLGLVTAFVVAAIALLVAFGVDLTDGQKLAVVGFVGAAFSLGTYVRSRVSPVRR